MPRLAAQAKGEYYPTPQRLIPMFANRMLIASDAPPGQAPLLDPCCGSGLALAEMQQLLVPPAHTQLVSYGVELNDERAQIAAQALDLVLAADFLDTAISNNAYSILFLNPPYDHYGESPDGGPNQRAELIFLRQSTRYLAPSGILIYIIPQQILAHSAEYLANNYRDHRVFRFPHPEFDRFHQVAIMAARRAEHAPNPDLAEAIQAWAHCDPELLPSLDNRQVNNDANEPFVAPVLPHGEIRFQTRQISAGSALSEATRRGVWQHPTVRDRLNHTEARQLRPLMPLRRGHLTQLIAAGMLNNQVLGQEDQRCLIKARYTKTRQVISETEEKTVTRERPSVEITSLNLQSGHITTILP